jgi:hypothetical protein
LICGKLPFGYSLSFDAIILTTKFPIPVKAVKNGRTVRIPLGVVIPKKNTTFDDQSLTTNTLVERVRLAAQKITELPKARGSHQHHRFSYRINNGEISARRKKVRGV